MPHVFGKRYLRVKTPMTTDGKTLDYDQDRQVKFSITELPLSARGPLEKENSRTPLPYRHDIIEINEDVAPDPKTMVKGAGKDDGGKGKKTENGESDLV